MNKYQYEISLEKPNIQESGSTFSRIETTYDEKEAFELLANGRNRLERIGRVDGKSSPKYMIGMVNGVNLLLLLT